MITATSRREFLKTAGLTAGGLMVGFCLPARTIGASAAITDSTAVNAFIKISSDNDITLIVPKSEMGQGVYTGYAQLLAEELELDWQGIRVEAAPVAPAYNIPGMSMQFTGGSMSIRTGFQAMREAGATARTLLISAAAEKLNVSPNSLHAAHGNVVHGDSGRTLSYGSLAAHAATLTPPSSVTLKEPSQWQLIGKPLHRIDTLAKTNGTAGFGVDTRLPNQHYALVARAPSFGATVKSFDDTAAKAIAGVVVVKQVPSGIAVIATNTWAARKGRDALVVDWAAGPAGHFSSAKLAQDYAEKCLTPGVVAYSAGVISAPKKGQVHLTADYATPYLSHASMEPLNCTVAFSNSGCDVYLGTQMQTMDQLAAADVAGLKPEQVHVHTTFLGGGFGRRGNLGSDVVREAVAVANGFPAPVMTVWTREDDMRGGYYRPQSHSHLTATLDTNGHPAIWTHTQAVQPLLKGGPFSAFTTDPKTGLDKTTHEGASELPYAIKNVRVDVHDDLHPVPVLWWRSVGHSNAGFVVESFIDECAHAAHKDPLAYRLALLADKPKHIAALKLAAEKAGWGTPLPKGRARGIAVHESFSSVVAEVAEVSLENGKPRVHRVVAAMHCGTVINPNLVAQQLESAVTYGLSAALYGRITIADGRVEQSNFDNYEVMRINTMPVVEAHIVPSTEAPTGVGEPGLPPLAAAVANALYALSGVRARQLPLSQTNFSKA